MSDHTIERRAVEMAEDLREIDRAWRFSSKIRDVTAVLDLLDDAVESVAILGLISVEEVELKALK
jgi:hypothetical protein